MMLVEGGRFADSPLERVGRRFRVQAFAKDEALRNNQKVTIAMPPLAGDSFSRKNISSSMLGTAAALIVVCIPFVMLLIAIAYRQRATALRWLLVVICFMHGVAFALGRNNEEMLIFTIPTMALCVLSSILATVLMWAGKN